MNNHDHEYACVILIPPVELRSKDETKTVLDRQRLESKRHVAGTRSAAPRISTLSRIWTSLLKYSAEETPADSVMTKTHGSRSEEYRSSVQMQNY